MKKVIISVLVLLVLAASFFTVKLFVIGDVASDDSLSVQVEESDGQLNIYIQVTDSAKAISNIKLRYEGTSPHLDVYTVLCSPFHGDGEKFLYYELLDETEVWVGNMLVWQGK